MDFLAEAGPDIIPMYGIAVLYRSNVSQLYWCYFVLYVGALHAPMRVEASTAAEMTLTRLGVSAVPSQMVIR